MEQSLISWGTAATIVLFLYYFYTPARNSILLTIFKMVTTFILRREIVVITSNLKISNLFLPKAAQSHSMYCAYSGSPLQSLYRDRVLQFFFSPCGMWQCPVRRPIDCLDSGELKSLIAHSFSIPLFSFRYRKLGFQEPILDL